MLVRHLLHLRSLADGFFRSPRARDAACPGSSFLKALIHRFRRCTQMAVKPRQHDELLARIPACAWFSMGVFESRVLADWGRQLAPRIGYNAKAQPHLCHVRNLRIVFFAKRSPNAQRRPTSARPKYRSAISVIRVHLRTGSTTAEFGAPSPPGAA